MGNYLITGGTGQIGSFLCEELVREGHKIVCYDFKPNTENVASIVKQVVMASSDVTDMSELLNTIKQNSIDSIVHLAALVLFDSIQHPAKAYQVNIIGTNNVMEAARLLEVKKVVIASSVAVLGALKPRRTGIADEDDIPNPPFDPYSTSKITDELMGRFYRETYGLDINCLRITSVWGPRRYWGYTGQFNEFVRKVAVGEDAIFPEDFSYGGEKLRWMYVKDAGHCISYVSSLKKTKSYLYNLGTKTPFNHMDVSATVKTIVPTSRITMTERDAPTKISSSIAGPNGMDIDCSRLYDELLFKPRFSLDTAMKDMIDSERTKAGLSRS